MAILNTGIIKQARSFHTGILIFFQTSLKVLHLEPLMRQYISILTNRIIKHKHRHIHTHTRTNTHTYTKIHIHTHHIHMRARVHTHSLTHTYTQTSISYRKYKIHRQRQYLTLLLSWLGHRKVSKQLFNHRNTSNSTEPKLLLENSNFLFL